MYFIRSAPIPLKTLSAWLRPKGSPCRGGRDAVPVVEAAFRRMAAGSAQLPPAGFESWARGDQVVNWARWHGTVLGRGHPASLDLDGPVLQLHLGLQGGLQGLSCLCSGCVLTHRRQLDVLHLDVTALER